MKPLLDRLVDSGVLVCPACASSALALDDDCARCAVCEGAWPVRYGVPNFLAATHELREVATDEPDPALVERLLATLELAPDDANRRSVSDVVRRAAGMRSGNSAIDAEIAEIASRFWGEDAPIEQAAPSPDANREPRGVLERHYVPERLAPGAPFSANVRVLNAGSYPWSSHTSDPLLLVAQWADDPTPKAIVRLPIDIEPGRAISLPVRLHAPARAGRHTLRLTLSCESGATALSHEVPVRIDLPQRDWESRIAAIRAEAGITGYEEDHKDAMAFVRRALVETGPAPWLLLEVGCGVTPYMTWVDGCEVLGLDVSLSQLELGSLSLGARRADKCALLAADAMAPPLSAGSLDAVIMFSTLHHFPEPEALLRKLATLVRPKGFIAVLCEPVGYSLEDWVTVRDLYSGINEQTFSLHEYRGIFEAAGLEVRDAKVSGVSLKAILGRRAAPAP